MEYYAAETKKELLPFAATWMELENIMLKEIRHLVKDKYHMISLIKESNEQNKLTSKTETETWKHGTDSSQRGGGRGKMMGRRGRD